MLKSASLCRLRDPLAILRAVRISLFGLTMTTACSMPAVGQEIAIHSSVTTFSRDQLSTIDTILKFRTAAVSEQDTAVIFLKSGDQPGELAQEIQVVNEENQPFRLADREGPDCTLESVGVFRKDREPFLVVATRTFRDQYFSQSSPGPMEMKVYWLDRDDGPGMSQYVFRSKEAPVLTRPICELSEAKKIIRSIAKFAVSSPKPPSDAPKL